MNKKMILSSFVATIFMVILMTVCHAAGSIPKGDVALGGITIGASEDYVRGVYGEPSDISYKTTGAFGKMKIFQYGESFFVTFNNNGKVIEIMSDENNGIKTPPGFTVGMPLSDVRDYYGPVGYEGKSKDGGRFIRYSPEWGLYISYGCDEDGIISNITVYISP